MRKTILAVAIASLTGCTTKYIQPEYDKTLLKRCDDVPVLESKDGAAVILWSQKAGPGITDCIRNHNALVTIIEKSK